MTDEIPGWKRLDREIRQASREGERILRERRERESERMDSYSSIRSRTGHGGRVSCETEEKLTHQPKAAEKVLYDTLWYLTHSEAEAFLRLQTWPDNQWTLEINQTEEGVQEIISDLEAEGYSIIHKEGIKNIRETGYAEGGSNRVADFRILLERHIEEELLGSGSDGPYTMLKHLLEEVENW